MSWQCVEETINMESTQTSAQHIVGAQESITDTRVAFGDGVWPIVGVQQSIIDTRVAFGDGICQSRRAVWSPAIIAHRPCVTSAAPWQRGSPFSLAWLRV